MRRIKEVKEAGGANGRSKGVEETERGGRGRERQHKERGWMNISSICGPRYYYVGPVSNPCPLHQGIKTASSVAAEAVAFPAMSRRLEDLACWLVSYREQSPT